MKLFQTQMGMLRRKGGSKSEKNWTPKSFTAPNKTANLRSNLNRSHRTLLRMPPEFGQYVTVLLFTLSILRQMVDHLMACAQAE